MNRTLPTPTLLTPTLLTPTLPSPRLRQVILALVAAATAVALTACGSSSTAGSSGPGMPGVNSSSSSAASSTPVGPAASGPHNPADVTFAADMIPHHRQAVTMAEMAMTQATNATVKSLAASIKAAQEPEIRAMSGWLTGWGQPVPASGQDMSQMGASTTGSTGGSGMGGMSGTSSAGIMGGMMSDQEMTQLSNTHGAAFDKLWLQMMTAHHQGAVASARTELTEGTNSEAKQLAQSIVDSQSKEITTMTTLLGTLGS